MKFKSYILIGFLFIVGGISLSSFASEIIGKAAETDIQSAFDAAESLIRSQFSQLQQTFSALIAEVSPAVKKVVGPYGETRSSATISFAPTNHPSTFLNYVSSLRDYIYQFGLDEATKIRADDLLKQAQDLNAQNKSFFKINFLHKDDINKKFERLKNFLSHMFENKPEIQQQIVTAVEEHMLPPAKIKQEMTKLITSPESKNIIENLGWTGRVGNLISSSWNSFKGFGGGFWNKTREHQGAIVKGAIILGALAGVGFCYRAGYLEKPKTTLQTWKNWLSAKVWGTKDKGKEKEQTAAEKMAISK